MSYSLAKDLEIVLSLIDKYKHVPMSYADACVIRMAANHPKAVVVATDSDFLSCRIHRNVRIPLVLQDDRG
jgi:rRNA-processing protein FCF1